MSRNFAALIRRPSVCQAAKLTCGDGRRTRVVAGGEVLLLRRHGRRRRLRLALLRDTLPGEGAEEGQVGEDSGEEKSRELCWYIYRDGL